MIRRKRSCNPAIDAFLEDHAERWTEIYRAVMRQNPGWAGKDIRAHMPAAQRRAYRNLMDRRHGMTMTRALAEIGASL